MAKSEWLITGSVAAHHWFPDLWETSSDLDILSPAKVKAGQGLFVDTQWHEACTDIIVRNRDEVFVDADMLFTIKFSHAEWDVKWPKTMSDIWKFQRSGCVLIPEFIPRLKEVWKEVHGKKHVNLKQPVTEFFSHDVVHREYPHEEVHQAVKFHTRPMHEHIRPNLKSVWCSREMFDGLSEEMKLQCAMEEMMVTAIERRRLSSLSPRRDILSAITFAHKNLIVSMTTGWFNDFLIINAPILLGREKRDIMTHQINKAVLTLEQQFGKEYS